MCFFIKPYLLSICFISFLLNTDVCPSVSSGVIANVVKIPGPLHHHGSSKMEAEIKNIPVMLQTTAAVHPGASGGAVVNSDGHMIGLVTR